MSWVANDPPVIVKGLEHDTVIAMFEMSYETTQLPGQFACKTLWRAEANDGPS